MRVLQDTNVVVSAVTTRGLCADVFRAVSAEHELVTCPQNRQEVRHILSAKFSVPENLISEYLELVNQDAIMAEDKASLSIPIKDKADARILAAAIAAGVQVVVTGDRGFRISRESERQESCPREPSGNFLRPNQAVHRPGKKPPAGDRGRWA